MVQITIDGAMRDKLSAAREEVRLVDEDGNVVGMFRPADLPPYDHSLIPPISDEELDRRVRESGRTTLPEILERLKRLA